MGSIPAARYGMSTSSVQADATYRNPNDPWANSYIYSVTFTSFVGDVPLISVNTTLFERLCGGSVSVREEVPGTMRHIKVIENSTDLAEPQGYLTIDDGPWVNETRERGASCAHIKPAGPPVLRDLPAASMAM